MVESMLVYGVIGGLGGLLRALLGVRKAIMQKRTFVLSYFLFTVACAVIIGAVVGSVFGVNKATALIVGYAGTDILEGAAKSLKLTPINIG